jgi:TRAP-type C4-dicarboxylate transport system permease small subunit
MQPNLRAKFERFLESIVLSLMGSLALLVIVAVVFRKAGASIVWYDEVASVLLAWLTYYCASLAALKRAHIGFPKLVMAAPLKWRWLLHAVREVIVVGFFLVVAWSGWQVLVVLEGTYLVSLPWVPIMLTQSVIPIGALLFIVAELLSFTDVIRAEAAAAEAPPS